jgi:hypothetical protein
MKFYGNPPRGIHTVLCGKTDGHDEADGFLSPLLCEHPHNRRKFCSSVYFILYVFS